MTFVDQHSDKSLKVLSQILHVNPEYASLLRDASAREKTAKEEKKKNFAPSNKDFAWPENRLYNITTPKDAILSKLYASVSQDVPENIMARIDNALTLHDVKTPEVAAPKPKSEKQASEQHFVFPDQRRGRINTKEQLKSAEEMIHRQRYILDSEMKTLGAVQLVKRAEELGTKCHYKWLYKQAGLTYCHRGKLVEWLEARKAVTKTASCKEQYQNAIELAEKIPFWYYDHKTLVKLAGHIHRLDKRSGVDHYYNKKLLDPVHTVFNSEKVASEHMNIAGRIVPQNKLAAIDCKTYGDILGDDVVPEITIDGTADGEVDVQKLGDIINTLPKDIKDALIRELGL